MIQIISKTKKYVTIKMPINVARKAMLIDDDKQGIHKVFADIKEVEPTAAEKKAISISRKQFERGEFISLDDLIKKYAW